MLNGCRERERERERERNNVKAGVDFALAVIEICTVKSTPRKNNQSITLHSNQIKGYKEKTLNLQFSLS